MRLVCLLMVVLLLCPLVYPLTLPPAISPQSLKFNTKSEIKSEVNSLKNKCTGPSDYIYKGSIFALELYLPTLIGSKLLAKNLASEFLGKGLKTAGLSGKGVSLSKRLILPKFKSLRFLKPTTLLKKHLVNFLVGTIRRRPTPGGLKLASRTAIQLTAESYYYVASRNPNSPHLKSAERHLQNAVDEYSSYTGLLDALTLTYSQFSPEGYDKILSECLAAIDDLQIAKEETPSKIVTS